MTVYLKSLSERRRFLIARRRKSRPPARGWAFATCAGGLVAMVSAVSTGGLAPASAPVEQLFALCGGGQRVTCVVDGDTIWLDGEKIRLADIDAPEVGRPQCASEEALGQAATARLAALLNEGPFEMEAPSRRAIDPYGRALRTLSRDGRSLGAQLVDEGLARPWRGRRASWC